MTLPEFLLGLFQRVTPVSAESMANLKVALLQQYSNNLNQMQNKMVKNNQIKEKQEKLAGEMNGVDEHSPEYQEKLFEFQALEKQLEQPSFFEKVISFFDKPYVRVLLMALFGALSWWITKKITQKKEDKEIDEEEDLRGQRGNYNYPPPPPFYQPYGYGYGYPPQHGQHK